MLHENRDSNNNNGSTTVIINNNNNNNNETTDKNIDGYFRKPAAVTKLEPNVNSSAHMNSNNEIENLRGAYKSSNKRDINGKAKKIGCIQESVIKVQMYLLASFLAFVFY